MGQKIKRITMKVKKLKSSHLPGAWVVSPKDKGRKSIKGDKIYLEDEKEFEIEIFNPLKESVLVDIRLNSNSVSKTGLVVKPGQRIYLDCFIDDRKKFIFKTYNVENTNESLEAISDNGLLEVFFYKEQAVNLNGWNNRFHKIIINQPIYYPYYQHYYYPYNPYVVYCGGTSGISSTTLTTLGNSMPTTTTVSLNGSSNGYGSLTSGSSLYTSNACNNSINNNYYSSDLSNIETGRVEKGQKSNQKFETVDMEFENNYIHHLVYKLLPNSRKPKEIDDISKNKKVMEKLKIGNEATELLVKLKDLLDCGVLTPEEFTSKKSEILSRI